MPGEGELLQEGDLQHSCSDLFEKVKACEIGGKCSKCSQGPAKDPMMSSPSSF